MSALPIALVLIAFVMHLAAISSRPSSYSYTTGNATVVVNQDGPVYGGGDLAIDLVLVFVAWGACMWRGADHPNRVVDPPIRSYPTSYVNSPPPGESPAAVTESVPAVPPVQEGAAMAAPEPEPIQVMPEREDLRKLRERSEEDLLEIELKRQRAIATLRAQASVNLESAQVMRETGRNLDRVNAEAQEGDYLERTFAERYNEQIYHITAEQLAGLVGAAGKSNTPAVDLGLDVSQSMELGRLSPLGVTRSEGSPIDLNKESRRQQFADELDVTLERPTTEQHGLRIGDTAWPESDEEAS